MTVCRGIEEGGKEIKGKIVSDRGRQAFERHPLTKHITHTNTGTLRHHHYDKEEQAGDVYPQRRLGHLVSSAHERIRGGEGGRG